MHQHQLQCHLLTDLVQLWQADVPACPPYPGNFSDQYLQ